MIQTVEATIDERGNVQLREPVLLAKPSRALVTIFDGEVGSNEPALLTQLALAADWNRPEEAAAWAHLQRVP